MKTLIKINSIFGKLIFEYECKENSFKKTIEKAVKLKTDLSYADLRYANLSGANLSGANLSSANLSSADLSSANLSSTDLSGANLSYADLSSANLSSTDLSGANLSYADLPIFCKWKSSIIENKIQIGCKTMTIEKWDSFFKSSEEFETKRNTKEFKQIQAVYLANKVYLEFLNN